MIKGKRHLLVFLISLLLLLMILSGIIYKASLINSWQILTNKASCVTEQELVKELRKTGSNILLLDRRSVILKIKDKYPCIKDLNISYKFFNNLAVETESRVGKYRVTSFAPASLLLDSFEASPSSSSALLDWNLPVKEDNNITFLLDDQGVVFTNSTDNILPLIYVLDPLKIGSKLTQDIVTKLDEVSKRLSVMEIPFEIAKIAGDTLMINSTPKLVFSLSNDILTQLYSLQLILNKSKIDSREVELIDLRFSKPVVVYSSKKK